ncbi:MAG: hypothetical protein ACRDM1_11285 [Gaiellaceae bacterium]
MNGMEVVTSDNHKLGAVVGERDDCAIVRTGHVFRAEHAIPREFLHEHEGTLRATVSNDVIVSSPKVDADAFDAAAVREHYGLDRTFVVEPDPDGVGSADTVGVHHGVEPGPEERLGTLGGANDPSIERPSSFDREATTRE